MLVLASASKGRFDVLTRAGVRPRVVVSTVDEEALTAGLEAADLAPARLPVVLAAAKCADVAARLAEEGEGDKLIVVGCDSMLEFDGEIVGKPADAAQAIERLTRMSGRSGILHTGHAVMRPGDPEPVTALASTEVQMDALTAEDIRAYVATGEPLHVAGSFTLDGLGGPFISGVVGDPSNVVGISLPLLRRMLDQHFGVPWRELWNHPDASPE